MNRLPRIIVGLLLCLQVGATAQPPGRSTSIPPKNGYVPDEQTAVKIAEAILMPIFGTELVTGERPFHGHLEGNIWIIEGTLHTELGGVAMVKIQRSDGRVVSVVHGK